MKNILFICCLLNITWLPSQVILDSQNKISISLSNGSVITLYGKANSLNTAYSNEYFYLPTNLRLSKRDDGVPEFLYAKYTTEERADQGGVQGAILHFLMQWGLTAEQQTEAEGKLREEIRRLAGAGDLLYKKLVPESAVIKGAVTIAPAGNSFKITSATLSDIKSASLITSGNAPVMEGSKVAVASKMDAQTAQLFASTLEKGRGAGDLSVTINYKYDVLFPAIDGRIRFNWSKLESVFQDYFEHMDKQSGGVDIYSTTTKTKIGWMTFQKTSTAYIQRPTSMNFYSKEYQSEFLSEKKIVEVFIDQNLKNEMTDKVVASYIEMFMNSMEAENAQEAVEAGAQEDGGLSPQNLSGIRDTSKLSTSIFGLNKRTYYNIDVNKLSKKFATKTEEFNLKFRTMVPLESSITENLLSWYNAVRSNRSCVYSVNLNDKFFSHRDVLFILDLDAKDIFKDQINFVTINLQKKRFSGNDFNSSKTIDYNYLQSKGPNTTITYARGEDNASEMYEYKAQWSLRGGVKYPENPQWVQGDWQGVNLSVPVKARMVEFEADLDDLKKADIVRATLQVRHKRFDQEVETNIPITVSKGQGNISQMIYIDKDQAGYAYRLVLTHKDKGKLAFDWETKITDDYVYAKLPEKFVSKNEEFWQKAIKAAENILAPGPNGEIPKDRGILHIFKEILTIFKKD